MLEPIEKEVLVHRYIYYVLNNNIISDMEYDALERKAREQLPATSLIQGVGSSLASSYPEEVVKEANNRNI